MVCVCRRVTEVGKLGGDRDRKHGKPAVTSVTVGQRTIVVFDTDWTAAGRWRVSLYEKKLQCSESVIVLHENSTITV